MKIGKYYSAIYLIISFSVLVLAPNICNAQGEEESVFEKVNWQQGPSIADIDKWAEIHVPRGFVFANGSDARLLMEAMGNPPSGSEVGFFAPDSLEWFVLFEFNKVGYIRDDEKDSLDADAILDSIRRGTEDSNKVRREKGFGGLSIIGWEVKPRYNEVTHNLEWAIRVQDDNGDLILNHNTRLLGRRGVMRVTLVVDPQKLPAVLPTYRAKLDDFTFKAGQSYAEFTQGDKIAKYGLTALVAGGAGAAAAKFGLFKLIGKFGKVIFLAVLAFLAGIWTKIKSFFTRGSGNKVKTITEETRFAPVPEETEWECHCGAMNDADSTICKECFEER